MEEVRKGRQTPTASVVLPYQKTLGQEAVEIYNTTGRACLEWQALLLYDLLAVNDEGLWVHAIAGYSVPRRNGKNEVICAREMWGLLAGERILHTAHRTSTSHSAWERLLDLLEASGIEILSSYRAAGKEHIIIEGGGRVDFRTRTSKGGLGEGFDLLIIDEAQEYQDDQESTLKYVVSASENPQTIMCGTPPTPISSGTVFTKLRKDTLAGQKENTFWAEWSVEFQTDPQDKEAWYETNPSLGTILKERVIKSEIGEDEIDFNIQRLGLWIRYNQKSAISRQEWEALQLEALPKLVSRLYVGIKYGHSNENVSMAIACKTEDGRVFVEAIDCKPIRAGNGWIIDFLKKADVEQVIVDGANGQDQLEMEMKLAKLPRPIKPTVKQIIVANSAFDLGVATGQLCHMGQPSLTQCVSNCETRAIGSNGGFGYQSIKDGVDISLMDSVILANWGVQNTKDRKKQKIGY